MGSTLHLRHAGLEYFIAIRFSKLVFQIISPSSERYPSLFSGIKSRAVHLKMFPSEFITTLFSLSA